MEAAGVVELTDFLETQLFIGIRADPLGTVDRARRKGLLDLATRK